MCRTSRRERESSSNCSIPPSTSLNSSAIRRCCSASAASLVRGRSAASTVGSESRRVNSSSSADPQLLMSTATAPTWTAAAKIRTQSGQLRIAMAIRSPGLTPMSCCSTAASASTSAKNWSKVHRWSPKTRKSALPCPRPEVRMSRTVGAAWAKTRWGTPATCRSVTAKIPSAAVNRRTASWTTSGVRVTMSSLSVGAMRPLLPSGWVHEVHSKTTSFFYRMVVRVTKWPAGRDGAGEPVTERALLEQRRHRKMTSCRRPAPAPCRGESLRMAKPLIPVDVIYEHALALIDAEGAQALNARRLAADLRCSTRTLYQQVGNREELIRALIGRHFSQLQLDFHEYDTWESTAVQWSLALDDALQAHPFLTELMNVDDRGAVTSYVNKLLKSLVQAGIDRRLPTDRCRDRKS